MYLHDEDLTNQRQWKWNNHQQSGNCENKKVDFLHTVYIETKMCLTFPNYCKPYSNWEKSIRAKIIISKELYANYKSVYDRGAIGVSASYLDPKSTL